MMVRPPSGNDENGVKKGPWTPEEDRILIDYIQKHASLPQLLAAANFNNMNNLLDVNALNRLQLDAATLAKLHLLHNMLQILGTPAINAMDFLSGPTFRENHQLYHLQPNTGEYQPSNLIEASQNTHPLKDLKFSSYINNDRFASSLFVANNNIPSSSIPQLPALIPASPEHRPAVVENNKINNPNEISNPSSTSTTFEAWGDLMDDEASDSYWRDIIE
ncbi:hypothetical protein GOBAR_DD22881 [Gossypium barbadense]|nr:hypothetical protein GOBAR_DD22881 [Gossypium barbadense]